MNPVRSGHYVTDRLLNVFLENDLLKVVFMPDIGGKMTVLLNKKTGRQILLEPQNPDKKYRRAFYGANFEEYDTSGFDECFPTVESCIHSGDTAEQEISFPDHGELWSRAWQHDLQEGTLILSIEGIRFPYKLEKRISLENDQLYIRYFLQNLSERGLDYIWSAHPLLQVSPSARLFVGDDIKEVFLNWASDDQIGKFGDRLAWPVFTVGRRTFDYSVVQGRDHGIALKCFTDHLQNGQAGIYFSDTNESLTYQFDTRDNPYLGMWLCYGGWPVDQSKKHLTVALEPCSGRPDSLTRARQRNESSHLPANGTKEWFLKIKIAEGKPDHILN